MGFQWELNLSEIFEFQCEIDEKINWPQNWILKIWCSKHSTEISGFQ